MRILLLLVLLPVLGSGQMNSSIVSAGYQDSVKNIDQEIYNGIKHLDYPSSIAGIAYYQSNEWQPGSINFRDNFYPDIFLKYDLVQNVVVIRHFNGSTGINLFTPRIKQFTLAGKTFLLLPQNKKSSLPQDLYEEIEKGEISFYIHRSKYIKEDIVGLQIEKEFIVNDVYYALRDGTWYTIKKEKDMLGLMKDKRNEVRNDLKKKRLKYRKFPEATLTEMVSYYNKITN